jgi:hypothetical protein
MIAENTKLDRFRLYDTCISEKEGKEIMHSDTIDIHPPPMPKHQSQNGSKTSSDYPLCLRIREALQEASRNKAIGQILNFKNSKFKFKFLVMRQILRICIHKHPKFKF